MPPRSRKKDAKPDSSKGATDAPLTTYRAKRSFDKTPEPRGGQVDESAAGAQAGVRGRFVVQRHRARRLHYDFRLEIDGVLVSWAVPKGPTLDPNARRLAQHVEDHPIEYLDFEGVIPRGEYGGGDVIVWDRGTFEPADGKDVRAGLAKGDVHVDLYGEKLAGRFALVRRGHDGEQWLMIHKHDDAARAGWDPEDFPKSVKSGRTNEEVAADPDALWRSDQPAATAEVKLRGGGARAATPLERVAGPSDEELAALDALGPAGEWEVAGRTVRLTNLDKVLFPGRHGDAPVVKRELVRAFACLAPYMLPFLTNRPVNAHRFPNGVDAKGFWQKELPSHAPEWLERWHNDDADPGESEWYAVLNDVPSVVWMANNAAIELHAWTSQLPNVREPTSAMIDIDPGPESSFDDVLLLARLYRTALDHLGVVGRPKVTGQRGVQIWVPVRPGYAFDETRAWVEQVSRAIGGTVPDLVSWKWFKGDRGGKARLDYTQNAINRTLVAPYSTRPAAGAPVSVPLEWDELDEPGLTPDRWTIRTIEARLREAGDPFAVLVGMEQDLPAL